jgi:hypothetical protein
MFLKRDVFNEVEGFDEDYFMYGEDIDFSYKLTKAGFKNHYLGTTNVLHYKGESTQRNGDYYKRFYGAMKIFYRKHFNSNWALNAIVNTGVSLASIFGRTNGSRRKYVKATNARILTEDFSLLKAFSDKMELPVQSVSKTIFQEDIAGNTLFVFDVRYMNYSQILSVMKGFKGNGNSFRIIPPGSRFMIGSDKSDEKGEVFVF